MWVPGRTRGVEPVSKGVHPSQCTPVGERTKGNCDPKFSSTFILPLHTFESRDGLRLNFGPGR